MAEIIDVVIDDNGEVEVSVKGVSGKKCKDITLRIELALGSKVKDVETEEMKGVKTTNVNYNRNQ